MEEKKLYLTAITLTLMQIIGGFASEIGIILASIFIFYHVAFSKKLNLIAIFILLMPSIVFREGPGFSTDIQNQYGETSYIAFYFPSLVNTLQIGPLAVSTKLFSALAVPVRLFRLRHMLITIKLFYHWCLSLGISIIGLYLSHTAGLFSTGGITVGLRIVLSVGAVFIPLSFFGNELIKQLNIIIKISAILFILGFINNHWIFITASFPALLLFDKSKFWKTIGLILLIIFIYFGTTFTIRFITISSIVLLSLNKIWITKNITKLQLMRFVYIVFPIVFILLVINIDNSLSLFNLFSSDSNLYMKLFDDRLPIWKQSLDFILDSDFFVVASGRDLTISFLGNTMLWGAGAHNIYLESARQLGLFSTILLFIIIFHYLFKTLKVNDSVIMDFMFSMLSVYLIYGLTGNSLIYDGVGFMYWLIIGQIYNNSIMKRKDNENFASFSG